MADACHGVRDGHAGQAGAFIKRILHTRSHEEASPPGGKGNVEGDGQGEQLSLAHHRTRRPLEVPAPNGA